MLLTSAESSKLLKKMKAEYDAICGKEPPMKLNHYKQIPTTFQTIRNQVASDGVFVPQTLIKCISQSDGAEYEFWLLIVSLYLERLSRLVFRDKDGSFKKLPEQEYKTVLFEYFAETVEEVGDLAEQIKADPCDVKTVYKILWQIADLVCPMMACEDEQAFVGEYAYAIDYVIKNHYNIPKPEIRRLFPTNYENFNPSGFVSKWHYL